MRERERVSLAFSFDFRIASSNGLRGVCDIEGSLISATVQMVLRNPSDDALLEVSQEDVCCCVPFFSAWEEAQQWMVTLERMQRLY